MRKILDTTEKPRRASVKSTSLIETDASEIVVQIHLSDLHDFPNHPFKVRDDEAMRETAESVKAYGRRTAVISAFIKTKSSVMHKKYNCEFSKLTESEQQLYMAASDRSHRTAGH